MPERRILGPRIFTLEEANALLPVIRERLTRFQKLYRRYEACRRDLNVLRLVSNSGGNEENPDQQALAGKQRQEKGLLRELHRLQEDILETGCVPKSYREGLVDFFALKNDRLVLLCWKQEEERIEAWHTLEGGFAGRMPLSSFHD